MKESMAGLRSETDKTIQDLRDIIESTEGTNFISQGCAAVKFEATTEAFEEILLKINSFGVVELNDQIVKIN